MRPRLREHGESISEQKFVVPTGSFDQSGMESQSPVLENHAMLRSLCLLTALLVLPCAQAALEQPTPESKPRKHWAFEPIRKVNPPPDPMGRSVHPIDLFVAAKLREKGLVPVSLADRRTLARRVYFDLIGLPPRPEDSEAFATDRSPQALAKLVDKLLASPQYGERWGRYWMDVVRYADTAGDNADYPIPEVRLYRDYIIDSFNADKPYDQFVREQIAGDILAKQGPPEHYAEQVIATGFIALSRRYGTGPGELWHLVLEDTIETTGRTFLGLTLRCARCHDHKFDPVTTEDYYALYGFFASTRYPWAGSEEVESKKFNRMHFAPLVPLGEAAPRLQAHDNKVRKLHMDIQQIEKEDAFAISMAQLKEQMAALSSHLQEIEKQPAASQEQAVLPLKAHVSQLKKQHDDLSAKLQEKLKPLRIALRNLQKPGLPTDLPGAYAVQDDQPVNSCIQIRGDPANPGPAVERNIPRFLAGNQGLKIPAGSSGRLQLAEWLTRPENPLTARVLVNRIWQHHFGKGIVASSSNFGLRGDEPTHPELLDWLTDQFIERGWSIKALHRLIVSSQTYQLSSSDDLRNLEIDPGNQWCWRQDRRRLDAEAIRDAMMTVSGTLDLTRPAEHPFPTVKDWVWTQHNPFKEIYASNHRSVYLMTQRFQRHPYLALFDGPDTNTSTDVRSNSTVPLQALYLMNNNFVRDQAAALAKRVMAVSQDERLRINLAYELAWSRKPVAVEIQKACAYLERYRQELERSAVASDRQELETWTSYARVILSANEFLYLE